MCYVYKFISFNDEILYIGKTTTSIKYRMTQHFTNGHLNKNIYKDVKKIYYTKCLNRDDMSIKERYLINTLNPKHNKEYNNSYHFNFKIDDFNWVEFNLNDINGEIIKLRKEYGTINTSDFNTNSFIDQHGYTNIEHNHITPRFYSYIDGIMFRDNKHTQHTKIYKRIDYYTIDGEIYISLKNFWYSGTSAAYRKKLIDKCNLNKADFIKLTDITMLKSSNQRTTIFIKLDSAIRGVGLDVNSYQIHNRSSKNNKEMLCNVEGLKKYVQWKGIA